VRPFRKILALLIVSCSTLVVTASPCLACGCTARTPRQILRQSDAAFVGRVVDQRAVDAQTTVQTFQVEGVYKGLLGPSVDVVAHLGAGGGSDCAVLFPEGTNVAVMLRHEGDAWTTDGCSLLTWAQLRRAGPPPSPPLPQVSGSATPTAIEAAPSAPAAGSSGLRWQAAVAGALLGIAAIALVLSHESRRAARARPDPPGDPDAGAGGAEPPDPV
jgi:hypothetical protein